MAHDDLNPADLDELVAIIRGGTPGDLQCSIDAGELTVLPGVWVTLTGIESRLSGTILQCSVVCIASDTVPRTALGQLAGLWNTVRPRLDGAGIPRNGSVVSRTATIPGGDGRALPALWVPVLLPTNN